MSRASEPNAFQLLLMHPMDPRGEKLGGIETHIRILFERHPQDFRVLFVGVDEFGDLPLGKVTALSYRGREIDFLPVVRIDASQINVAAKTIGRSTTLRFALGALRHLHELRRALRGARASADIQRFEFALIPKLLRLPFTLMIHNEGSKDQKMDSLLKRFWFLHRINERVAIGLADRIFCVNESILRRIEGAMPRAAPKCELMSVSVDQTRFAPQPFDCADGIFRVIYAGRLDSVKDPPLMFRIAAGVHARLGGRFEFHYVGASDPARYPEVVLVEDFLKVHGFQPSERVAELAAHCHAGILTSFFEGLPCYLLETISVGRPFAALRLPQYAPLIVEGISGALIERSEPDDDCERGMVEAFLRLWTDIRAAELDPRAISALAEPYSVERQTARLFARHRALQAPTDSPAPLAPGGESRVSPRRS